MGAYELFLKGLWAVFDLEHFYTSKKGSPNFLKMNPECGFMVHTS